MISGLPGTGLGLMFFVLSALIAPFIELWAAARGRSSRARWRTVRNLVITALLVVVGITAMTVTLIVASRFVAPDNLSPPWRRLSDALVLVLLAIWAGSVMFVFVGLDLIRHDRKGPRPASESEDVVMAPPDAIAASGPVP